VTTRPSFPFARRLAAGGSVAVSEEDPSGLDEHAGSDMSRDESTSAPRGVSASEGARDRQAGPCARGP
jgi:hypothetical protein